MRCPLGAERHWLPIINYCNVGIAGVEESVRSPTMTVLHRHFLGTFV